MRFRRPEVVGALIVVLVALGGALAPRAPQATASQAAAPQRATSTPYTGDLSIFETPGREQRLHIEQVMDLLGIAPGKSVADIGAGSGWFTVRAAKRVTVAGTVYAVDISPDAIEYIDDRIAEDKLHNVKTIRSKPDDPELPPHSVDVVLLLKTYHEVANPVMLLRNVRPALRAGARVGIIDRTGNGSDHGVRKEVVIREAGDAGYRLVGEHDDLVKDDHVDYFLIFTLK